MSATEQVTLERLGAIGVIAVLRGPSAATAVAAGEALVRGGVRALELTYTVPDAAEAIAELRERCPADVAVGAGTLRTVAQVEEAVAAGAQFLVAPATDDPVVAAMVASGRPTMAGALTPTEVVRAVGLGVSAVKLFPAGPLGLGMLKALREPFPDVRFVPTGGVSAGNLADWLDAGAFAVGAGGSLCPFAEVASGDLDPIERRARELVDALTAARR